MDKIAGDMQAYVWEHWQVSTRREYFPGQRREHE